MGQLTALGLGDIVNGSLNSVWRNAKRATVAAWVFGACIVLAVVGVVQWTSAKQPESQTAVACLFGFLATVLLAYAGLWQLRRIERHRASEYAAIVEVSIQRVQFTRESVAMMEQQILVPHQVLGRSESTGMLTLVSLRLTNKGQPAVDALDVAGLVEVQYNVAGAARKRTRDRMPAFPALRPGESVEMPVIDIPDDWEHRECIELRIVGLQLTGTDYMRWGRERFYGRGVASWCRPLLD